MRCLVLGATGYVGGRLVPRLAAAGHRVRCLVRDQSKGNALERIDGVESVLGDAMDPDAVRAAMQDVDVVYHLVHSMERHDFGEADQAVAENVTLAADGRATRIVYLGGLRPPGADTGGAPLSRHLASRAEVGDIFLAGPVPAVVLQASIIIGSGSTSFEMLRHLAERLPVMPAPKWLDNPTQPVAIADVLHYMVAAADLPDGVNRTIDIGGPDVLTYRDLISRYARIVGQPTPIWLPTPVFPSGLSALAVSGLTPVSAVVAEPLLESLAHPMVCADGEPETVLPEPPGGRLDFEEAVRRALAVGPPEVTPTNGHPGPGQVLAHDPTHDPAQDPARDPALPAAHDPAGSGVPVLKEERRLVTSAGREDLWRVIESIGGDNGWYTLPLVWEARGVLDRALGGVGDYRGRRDPQTLRRGEVLDWWRVEDVEPGTRLRLRAEMRMPGAAWLEMSIGTTPDGRTEYRQRLTFRPAGPRGHLYWWSQRLGREVVFGVMARRLVRAAERLGDARVG
jgi:uncharacterized protein YbjT (DUF2867 family)